MDTSVPAELDREPLPIKQLPESLVNKIAAGEIIHRPASALKELLENSLDAGSTSIRVTVKDGGMKLLQIQDNGCGIKKEDLPLLCQRFATSKLSSFEDLLHIGTYGFRGEALASMSHVSDLSVITKTKADSCAWKASFVDGKLVAPKPGQTAEAKPCAGNDGTTISIANLFAQIPTRLSALRSQSEEYGRILDVMTKYSIHNPSVSFVCKKAGSANPDLTTSAFPSTLTSAERTKATAQAIKSQYGQSIARELLHVEATGTQEHKRKRKQDEEEEHWSADVHFTSANMPAKKMIFTVFVNHRLVDLPRLKRALEPVYTPLLPKGMTGGFVYVSLVLPPDTVDVNVHPTKASVNFLDEEIILERIADQVQAKLAERGASSRTFGVQTLLPGASKIQMVSKKRKEMDEDSDEGEENQVSGDKEDNDKMDVDEPAASARPKDSQAAAPIKKTYSHNKVRTSTKDRTLDSMLKPTLPQSQAEPSSSQKSKLTSSSSGMQESMFKDIKESECYLTSIKELRSDVKKGKHRQMTEILEKHTFVGVVDLDKCLSLIQYSTKLYLVNHGALAEELFYQLGLRQFGDMRRIKMQPAPPLKRLIELAVKVEKTDEGCGLSKPEIVQRIVDILMERRQMLKEYFAFKITEDGLVESLPMLLKDYIPNLDKLPYFLMRLGPQVDWTTEKECFETFLRELAYFYVPGPSPCTRSGDRDPKNPTEEEKAERWHIQHTLFPALRRYLVAPKSLLDGDVVQVADLPQLYKVFERC